MFNYQEYIKQFMLNVYLKTIEDDPEGMVLNQSYFKHKGVNPYGLYEDI